MMNQLETKFMAVHLPQIGGTGAGVKANEHSRRSADSTEKEGSEQYMPLEFEAELNKEEIDALKEKYPDKAEFELINTFKYRRRIFEFGTEMLYLMMDYWTKKIRGKAL